MKIIITTLALFLTLSLQSQALVTITRVTAATAEKDYGIKIRTHQSNPHQVGVWLEFKPEGELKDFSSVELSIAQGDHNLIALSLATETKDGVVTAMFNVDPSLLRDSRFTILKHHGGRTNTGHMIFVKDFLPAAGAKAAESTPAPAVEKPKAP
jgi:hypothetical protein